MPWTPGVALRVRGVALAIAMCSRSCVSSERRCVILVVAAVVDVGALVRELRDASRVSAHRQPHESQASGDW